MYEQVRFLIIFSLSCIFNNVNGLQNPYKYHSNGAILNYMKNFSRQTYLKTSFYPIGKSKEGYPLTVLEFNEPGNKLGTPNIKFIGNIHGDETIGREVLFHFPKYLEDNYRTDPLVKCLVNSTRIHILPTLNPDGFNKAKEGSCWGNWEGRWNSKSIDLNRNFPDYFHRNAYDISPKVYRTVIQPETAVILKWMRSTPFILSASLHGGAVVANYPFDTYCNEGDLKDGASLTPDNDVFEHLARTYAKNHGRMSKGVNCSYIDGPTFPEGITNGAKWYDLIGGMQDFNYVQHGCYEITLELSCCKYPVAKHLQFYVEENMKALLHFGLQALRGVRGLVLDSKTREPIPSAMLHIKGRKRGFKTTKRGEFWRLLRPGTYTIEVEAKGYFSKTQQITVNDFPENQCPDTEMTIITLKT